MNKRIKQLARRAGFATEETNITTGNYQDGKKYFYAEDFIEDELKKFAELIVLECSYIALEQKKWVENQEVFNPRDEQWNRAKIQQSQRIVDKINEHFGIEQ